MKIFANLQLREPPTIGILLCADKNDTLVKYTLPKNLQYDSGKQISTLPADRKTVGRATENRIIRVEIATMSRADFEAFKERMRQWMSDHADAGAARAAAHA